MCHSVSSVAKAFKNKRGVTMKRWDAIDDAVLIESIKRYPTNLGLAFQEAGTELGRTASSTSQRYYGYIKKNVPVIATGSDQGIASNTKIVPFTGDQDTDTRKAMMLAMFGSMDPSLVIEAFLDLLTMDEQKSLFKRSIAKLV